MGGDGVRVLGDAVQGFAAAVLSVGPGGAEHAEDAVPGGHGLGAVQHAEDGAVGPEGDAAMDLDAEAVERKAEAFEDAPELRVGDDAGTAAGEGDVDTLADVHGPAVLAEEVGGEQAAHGAADDDCAPGGAAGFGHTSSPGRPQLMRGGGRSRSGLTLPGQRARRGHVGQALSADGPAAVL